MIRTEYNPGSAGIFLLPSESFFDYFLYFYSGRMQILPSHWRCLSVTRTILSITRFVEYINHEKKYSPYTISAYQKDLSEFKEFCEMEFNTSKIEDVPYSLIRSWIVNRVEHGLTNRTINRKISSLKSYYNFLLRTKQISESPLRKHQALKSEKRVNVPFSEKEIREVLEGFEQGDNFESLRDRLIIEILYTTGMRRAELIELRDESIDLPSSTPKPHTVSLFSLLSSTSSMFPLLRIIMASHITSPTPPPPPPPPLLIHASSSSPSSSISYFTLYPTLASFPSTSYSSSSYSASSVWVERLQSFLVW